MQILKEDIKKNILLAAKKEFLSMGYTGASIRKIAKNSNVTLSNIYNYFKNKDDLFRSLVIPAISIMNEFTITEEESKKIPLKTYMEMFNLKETVIEFTEHTNLIYDNWDEFKLLFLYSHGSSLENTKEDIINNLTSHTLSLLERINNNSDMNKRFSNLVHNSSAFYVNFYVELIMHDISKDDALEKIDDLATFIYCGWKGIINKVT